jgi:hypothetical protein
MKRASDNDKRDNPHARGWTLAGQNKLRCICPGCPTYKGTGETQQNFCGRCSIGIWGRNTLMYAIPRIGPPRVRIDPIMYLVLWDLSASRQASVPLN